MLETIQTILRDYKGDEGITVSVETAFETLELDSLDMVELVMAIEEAFGITIEMNDPIPTVGDLLAIIEGAKQEA